MLSQDYQATFRFENEVIFTSSKNSTFAR